MRNLFKIIVVLFIVTASAATNAQTLKFGHIEFQALIQIMPEMSTAQIEMDKFQKDLNDVFDELYEKYQQILAELEQLTSNPDASEVRRNAKLTEFQEMQTRIENYRNNASQQIDRKQTELLQPIINKAQATIEEVARAQGLIYVFDSDYLLYKSNSSVDVLPLVKEKMGIK